MFAQAMFGGAVSEILILIERYLRVLIKSSRFSSAAIQKLFLVLGFRSYIAKSTYFFELTRFRGNKLSTVICSLGCGVFL